MKPGTIIDEFQIEGHEIVLRYPKMSDLSQLLSFINVMVAEKVYTCNQKKLTLREERVWLTNCLKRIKTEDMVYLVVTRDGKIIGGADIKRPKVMGHKHIGIFGIMLRKEARGQGIGEKLVATLILQAKKILKIKMVKLEVFARNKRGIGFYQKIGFQKVGTIKNGLVYYGRLMDEIIMVKYL